MMFIISKKSLRWFQDSKFSDYVVGTEIAIMESNRKSFPERTDSIGWETGKIGKYGGTGMKHLGTIVGAAIAGMFVMSVWGELAGAYGLVGGWFAAFIIIGVMWFMNHFVGLINNDGAWVDMAVGIGVAGTARGGFDAGFSTVVAALPTLTFVLIGGIAGGVCAHYLTKALNQNAE